MNLNDPEKNQKLTMSELNRLSAEEFRDASKTPIIIVLDNIRSQNNTGSVFRTADAFRLEAIYLCGITATPPHREIHKTALGATETVNWKYFTETRQAIEVLKTEGYQIISVEQTTNSVKLNHFNAKKGSKMALVFGNEINGVDETIINESNMVIEIPQLGTKHSLNVAVSVGIVIWKIISEPGFIIDL